MRSLPVLLTVLLTAGFAYYVYVPLPDEIQEPWKLMVLGAGFRTVMHLVRRVVSVLRAGGVGGKTGGVGSDSALIIISHLLIFTEPELRPLTTDVFP